MLIPAVKFTNMIKMSVSVKAAAIAARARAHCTQNNPFRRSLQSGRDVRYIEDVVTLPMTLH